MARVRATLRSHAHVAGNAETAVSFGEYVLDLGTRRLLRGNAEVCLTATEFKLLAALARHRDRIVTTQDLLRETWGTAYQNRNEYIRVYMHALRQKVELDPAHPTYILNVPGLGYQLRSSGA
jgi:two-component system KDP operon response regulator KdpE